MEFVSPILAVFGKLWNCSSPYASYVRDLDKNLNALDAAKGELMALKADVMRRVETYERRRMRRTEQVEQWRRSVEEIETEVDEILRKGRTAIHNKCLCGICPKNCWKAYKLSQRAREKLQNANHLKERGIFEKVADVIPSAVLDISPLDTIVGLDQKFEEAWRYTCDERTGEIIGIYGMGGVGKTTLLTKIKNELAKSIPYFEEMIWVTVSKVQTLEQIQDKIGKELQIFDTTTWSTKDSEEKGRDICWVLNTKRFVLLLDDLWEPLQLSKVGIPKPCSENKSKILFTTRDERICGYMRADKKIRVDCLKWDDAWDLFQENVGLEILNSHEDISLIAKAIAKECAGLPLALNIVGQAMATRKTPEEWRAAENMLRNINFSDVTEKVLPILKFSYDCLPNATIRSCFLYCAIFPEGWDIEKSYLIKLWMGEGFLGRCNNFYEAEDLGNDIIGHLKLSGLLERGKGDQDTHVHMHDLVRDMAVWIISDFGCLKENLVFVAGLNLTKVPISFNRWEKAERILLCLNSITKLSGMPNCPRLLTFIITQNPIHVISENFFQLMPILKVLDLSHNLWLQKLPSSIVELVSLEHLNLSYTSITELPVGFKRLTRLQFLYMNGIDGFQIIPHEVIVSLEKLRTLELYGTGVSDEVIEGSILSGGNEMLLNELKCLPELQRTSVTITSEQALRKFLTSPKLQDAATALEIRICRGLRSMPFSSLEKNTQLKLMEIRGCHDLEELALNADFSVSWMMKSSYFDNIETLNIRNCPALKDLTCLISVRSLKSLTVAYCGSMQEITGGSIGMDSKDNENFLVSAFPKLETLNLCELPELTSICSHALSLPLLREIRVVRCPKLQKLPLSTNSGTGKLLLISGEKEWWDGLQWKDEENKSAFQPFFKPRW